MRPLQDIHVGPETADKEEIAHQARQGVKDFSYNHDLENTNIVYKFFSTIRHIYKIII